MAHPHPSEGDGTRDERYKTREMMKLERRLFCGQKTEFPSMASWVVAALEMELMADVNNKQQRALTERQTLITKTNKHLFSFMIDA